MRAERCRNRLPGKVVEFLSLEIFISRSDKHPGALLVLLTAVAGRGLQPVPAEPGELGVQLP